MQPFLITLSVYAVLYFVASVWIQISVYGWPVFTVEQKERIYQALNRAYFRSEIFPAIFTTHCGYFAVPQGIPIFSHYYQPNKGKPVLIFRWSRLSREIEKVKANTRVLETV